MHMLMLSISISRSAPPPSPRTAHHRSPSLYSCGARCSAAIENPIYRLFLWPHPTQLIKIQRSHRHNFYQVQIYLILKHNLENWPYTKERSSIQLTSTRAMLQKKKYRDRSAGWVHPPLKIVPLVIVLDTSNPSLEDSAASNSQFVNLQTPLIGRKNSKNRMREAYYGSHTHTLRSHGMTITRRHVHDWVVLIVLVVVEVILNVIHPFYRFVGKDMMSDLKYPLKDNTVPLWTVPIYAVLLPIVIFLFLYLRRRDVYDLHHAILGLLFSVLITGVITDAIKDAVGRPRPDFFWRCFPDGKDVYDQWGNVICHGDSKVIREGHKSFPSGHTSWSFAGLGFLSLYLAGKIKAFDGKGHVAKLCIVVLPLLLASLVGISRVDDYWHHWQDVFAGGLIGLTVATFCYLQFFAPPYHPEGWGPYAFFRVLEEARAAAQESDAMNARDLQSTEAQIEIQPRERNNHASMGIASADDNHVIEGDIESGRR